MYLMAIAWLFGVPAYYLAKSKGRSGPIYGTITVLLGWPINWFGAFGFILPAAFLGVLYLIPEKPGAPGKAYLTITFVCPECGKTISFPRHREGVAELCPECGELIRVPEDEHSPKATTRDRGKPAVTQGDVCFESFARPASAHQLAAILKGNGVEARVSADDGGGMLPYLGSAQGYRIMIDVDQWDAAVAIEKECQQGET